MQLISALYNLISFAASLSDREHGPQSVMRSELADGLVQNTFGGLSARENTH